MVPGLSLGKYKIGLEHLELEILKVLRDERKHVNRSQKPTYRGSHWPNLGQLGIKIYKDNSRL